MTYSEIISNISVNLIKYFDEVYHSVELITIDKEKFPTVSNTNEWINLSPTDTKEILYIRRNGDDEVYSEEKIGSCSKSYKMRSSLRVVYFKDYAKNHDEILFKLMQSGLIGGTKLRSIIRDKFKLLKDESSGDFSFKPTTAYFAIDIYALWDLKSDICEQDFCVDIINPLKKEPCPVVANES